MTGYTLDANSTWIFAYYATEEQRRLLLSIPSAQAGEVFVALPTTRENFLSAEVVAPVAEATPQYDKQRTLYLYPGDARVCEMYRRCRVVGVDPDSLLTHQWHALAQFYDQSEAYLAADQGTGKSRIALVLASIWDARRVLVVCPKSISSQWEEEHRKVWIAPKHRVLFQHLTCDTLEGRRRVLRDLTAVGDLNCPIYATVNYEALAPLRNALLQWAPDVVICDELWRGKNRQAQVTKTLMWLTGTWRIWETLKGTIALAGTPWGNDVGDIWSQLRIVAPDVVPEDYWTFVQKHAKLEVQRVARGRTVVKPVGLLDPVSLIRRLDPVWFRASKETCLDLPPKKRRRIGLNLPQETWKLYRAVQKNGLAALGDELALAGAREVAIRLQQIAGGVKPNLVRSFAGDGIYAPAPNSSSHPYELLPCPKIKWLREFAQDVLASDRTARVLVWCQFIAEVKRVAAALSEILGYDRIAACWGGTPDDELTRVKESYQSRDPDGVQVLICQFQRMAAGNDLPATAYSVYFSHTWSHILRTQSEDRGHRIGNTTGVQIIDLVAKGTIDEQILRCLERKADFTAQMLVDTTGKLVCAETKEGK